MFRVFVEKSYLKFQDFQTKENWNSHRNDSNISNFQKKTKNDEFSTAEFKIPKLPKTKSEINKIFTKVFGTKQTNHFLSSNTSEFLKIRQTPF